MAGCMARSVAGSVARFVAGSVLLNIDPIPTNAQFKGVTTIHM